MPGLCVCDTQVLCMHVCVHVHTCVSRVPGLCVCVCMHVHIYPRYLGFDVCVRVHKYEHI